jgi:Ca-activated chloride channel family protein
MSRHRSLASSAVSALCIVSLTASAWTAPAMAKAGLDGEPTAAACAKYGYNLGREDRVEYQASAASSVQEVAVTGSRRSQSAQTSASPAEVVGDQMESLSAPPPPPPPPAPPPPPPMGFLAPAPAPAMRIVTKAAPQPQAGDIETERYPNAPLNSVKRVVDEPVSTFSIDVDTASYANVRRFLNDGQLPPRDSVRVEELVNYFRYAYPLPTSADEPFKPFVAVTPSPWSPGKQIVHIGLQGYDLNRSERPPLNLVFLIDTSGSMDEPDRLPLARQALNVLIGQLRPQDKVAMVAYAGSAGEVMAPTSGAEKLKMRCALATLEAGGSTAGGAGLALAYKLAEANYRQGAANRVILMTDGDFNVGVADPSKLKDFVAEKRKTGVYLSVYGYGRGNYNDVMMQSLAQNGNGTAGYVDSLDEARKLFREDFSSSVFPIADDVKIQVEFNPARVTEYRLIGYETRLLKREDFNNDKVDAGEVGSGASVTALYEITPAGGPASVDPLRYQGELQGANDPREEIAYLKIRYKLPHATTSKLMQRPITSKDVVRDLAQAPDSTRLALAVAAYGQKLRGDPWLNDSFGWPQIEGLAQTANTGGSEDENGLRKQFVGLVRKASAARSINE